MQQVFVPVLDAPVRGRGRGEAGQGERGGEHMLAKASVRVLGIEGVDQERIVLLNVRLDARLDWAGSGATARANGGIRPSMFRDPMCPSLHVLRGRARGRWSFRGGIQRLGMGEGKVRPGAIMNVLYVTKYIASSERRPWLFCLRNLDLYPSRQTHSKMGCLGPGFSAFLEALVKFFTRSILILLALYGLLFAVGDLYLARIGIPISGAVAFAIVFVGFQYLIGPWLIEMVVSIHWDDVIRLCRRATVSLLKDCARTRIRCPPHP